MSSSTALAKASPDSLKSCSSAPGEPMLLPAAPPDPVPAELRVDPRDLAALFAGKNWPVLSSTLLNGLAWLQKTPVIQPPPELQRAMHDFLQHFLYYFTQEAFVVPDEHADSYLMFGPTIANALWVTAQSTTDYHISLLAPQTRNILRILTLYGPRNHTRLNLEPFWKGDPSLTSRWWCSQFRQHAHALVNPEAHRNLVRHTQERMENVVDLRTFHVVSFGATYISDVHDRDVKQRVNALIQGAIQRDNVVVKNDPDPKSIAVVSGCWVKGHSVHRNQYHFVKALFDAGYRLTLVKCASSDGEWDTSLFSEVREVVVRADGKMSFGAVLENDWSMAYFADVGMQEETIALSNLRFAPVSAMSYGHSCSTFGSLVDYFIGSRDVEVKPWGEQSPFYSERFVGIPGLGVCNVVPEYTPDPSQAYDDSLVAVNAYSQKLTAEYLDVLKDIVSNAKRKVVFRFFAGSCLGFDQGFQAFGKDLVAKLGTEHVQICPVMSYPEYRQRLAECAFALESYPFGGCNTVTDSIHGRQPVLTWRGQWWRNRIGSAMNQQCCMDHFVCTSRDGYVRAAVKLIDDPGLVRAARTDLWLLDVGHVLFDSVNEEGAAGFLHAIQGILSRQDASS